MISFIAFCCSRMWAPWGQVSSCILFTDLPSVSRTVSWTYETLVQYLMNLWMSTDREFLQLCPLGNLLGRKGGLQQILPAHTTVHWVMIVLNVWKLLQDKDHNREKQNYQIYPQRRGFLFLCFETIWFSSCDKGRGLSSAVASSSSGPRTLPLHAPTPHPHAGLQSVCWGSRLHEMSLQRAGN